MAMGSKKYAQKIWRTRLVLLLILCACGFLSMSLLGRVKVERDTAARMEEALEKQQQLEVRKKEAGVKVEYIQSEESVEMEMRKNFDVAKDGEVVVVLMNNEKKQAPTPVLEEKTLPWWMFWRL